MTDVRPAERRSKHTSCSLPRTLETIRRLCRFLRRRVFDLAGLMCACRSAQEVTRDEGTRRRGAPSSIEGHCGVAGPTRIASGEASADHRRFLRRRLHAHLSRSHVSGEGYPGLREARIQWIRRLRRRSAASNPGRAQEHVYDAESFRATPRIIQEMAEPGLRWRLARARSTRSGPNSARLAYDKVAPCCVARGTRFENRLISNCSPAHSFSTFELDGLSPPRFHRQSTAS